MLKMDYTDDVNGCVIGECMRNGELFYQGRSQSKRFYAKTHDELVSLAIARKQELLDSLGAAFSTIYPANTWELREFI